MFFERCMKMEILSKEEFLRLLKEADKNKTIEDNDWMNEYGDPWYGLNTYEEVERKFDIKDDECIYMNAREINEIYCIYIEAIKNLKKGYDCVALGGRRGYEETVSFYFKKNKLKEMEIETASEYSHEISSIVYYFKI